MLRQMRSFTRGWVSYVLLFILASLFVLFLGNGQSLLDTIQFNSGNAVATGRGFTVTAPQLSRELEATLRFQRQQGQEITQADAVAQGLHMRLLENLILRGAINSYMEKVNVMASDAQVAEHIRQLPAVQNEMTGGFDQNAYDQFLINLGYVLPGSGAPEPDTPAFERDIRVQLTFEMLGSALADGARAPASYGALLLAYTSERRTVTVADAPASVVGAVPQPNDAQIQTFYEENAERLRIPEYRALTLVRATPTDFVGRVTVPEARIQEEYEARRAGMGEPERRSFVRMAFQQEAQARDAASRLSQGEAPEAVARATNGQLTRGENQTREEVADNAVAQAVFAARANGPATAVQSQLSPWTVVRVTSVTAARAPDFASVRQRIHDEIALEEANELVQAAVTQFDEARAAGTPIADAARAAGLPFTTIDALDAQGLTPRGERYEGLPEDMVQVAFETAEGDASDFLPVGDADVIVSVDRVTPSTVRPLADVREQLVQLWIGRERGRLMQEMANDVAAAVRNGQSFDQVIRERRLNIVINSQEFDRERASQLPRELAGLMFQGNQGEVQSIVRPDGAAALFVYVESIARTNAAEAPEAVEAHRLQMQQALGESLVEAVQNEIVADANVRRNTALIERLFNPQQNADQPAP